MAALIGYLQYGHHAGTVHRLAHKTISSVLRTWEGSITTYLSKDGIYTVYENNKVVAQGNVNNGKGSA